MTPLAFFVTGTPVPQGSMRAFGSRIIQSPEVKAWRAEVTAEVLTAAEAAGWEEPWDGPCALDLVFYLPRPKRPRWTWPAVRPDLDKLARAVMDALCPRDPDLRVLAEDSRVIELHAIKHYADGDHHAGVHIELTPLEAP